MAAALAMLFSSTPRPSGNLTGTFGRCNQQYATDGCKDGEHYQQYRCSPPVTGATKVRMTINSFSTGGDGGGKSKCDGKYHSDNERIVALSTGWYDKGKRCGKTIKLNANNKSVLARVVDKCDSFNGCDKEHDFQPPRHWNTVDASPAWTALEIPKS